METKKEKMLERALYEPVMKFLHSKFTSKFGNCHLEITADGHFEESIKTAVPYDIIFAFLGRKASPDLVGFIQGEYGIQDRVVVDVKREKITLHDIYQVKMYGDLFSAKYALLISPNPVPEEIKRVHKNLSVLYRFMSGWYVYIGEWSQVFGELIEKSWFPQSPF